MPELAAVVVEVERVAARGRRDGVDDLDVAGAAADVAGERLLDRLAVVAAARVDVRLRGEHHPGRAEAALRGVVVRERLLDRRQVVGVAEPFDRRDLGAVHGGERQEAGAAGLAVDEHGARAAAALLAAVLRAQDPELLAEHVQQRRQAERSRPRGRRR